MSKSRQKTLCERAFKGTPFQLPELVRRATLKKCSAEAANLTEQDSDGGVSNVLEMNQLLALRAELESKMKKEVRLGAKKGIATIRSRFSRNFADASDDPTQFDGWVRPENEDDDSSDDDVETVVDPARPASRSVSIDRVFCPVIQASGVKCVANYKYGHGKSMQKHVFTHCPDGRAVEGAMLWEQFLRDGKVSVSE